MVTEGNLHVWGSELRLQKRNKTTVTDKKRPNDGYRQEKTERRLQTRKDRTTVTETKGVCFAPTATENDGYRNETKRSGDRNKTKANKIPKTFFSALTMANMGRRTEAKPVSRQEMNQGPTLQITELRNRRMATLVPVISFGSSI